MSYTFVTYVANGVAEIQSKHENLTGIEYHIIKTLQISQQEKHHLVLLTAEKRYRISVSYLCKWPIKQDKVEMKIPDNIVQHTEVTVTKGNSISTSVSEVVDINRISTFKKLLRLTSFLYFIVEKYTFRGIVHCLSVEKLKRVEQFGLRRIFHMMLCKDLDALNHNQHRMELQLLFKE